MKRKLFSLFIILALLLSGCAAEPQGEKTPAEQDPPAAERNEAMVYLPVRTVRVDFPIDQNLSPYTTEFTYKDGSLVAEAGSYVNNAGPEHSEKHSYDEEGRLIRTETISEAGESVLTYEYDEEGRLIKRIGITHGPDLGGIALYQYDTEGRCEVVTHTSYMGTDPAQFDETTAYHVEQQIFEYGADGTLGKVLHLSDDQILSTYTCSYDAEGRLTEIICLQDDGSIDKTRLTYDSNGHLTKTESEYFTIEYTYDEFGNITIEEEYQNGSLTCQRDYVYRAFYKTNPYSAKPFGPMDYILSDLDPFN
jgi:YD repeat-containing protein